MIKLTIDNEQLTIDVSLRDEYNKKKERKPLDFPKKSSICGILIVPQGLLNCQLSIVNCQLKHNILYLRIFPQPLWNVENLPVENFFQKKLPQGAVDGCGKITRGVWKKSGCGSRANGTFPHNFLLILLILPKPMKEKIISILFQRKDADYALYL